MNQQRSRRFRASKEGVELVEEKSRVREEVIQKGVLFASLTAGLKIRAMYFNVIFKTL